MKQVNFFVGDKTRSCRFSAQGAKANKDTWSLICLPLRTRRSVDEKCRPICFAQPLVSQKKVYTYSLRESNPEGVSQNNRNPKVQAC